MLVETLGNQAGRTDPWGIRADGDRGSQKSRATEPRPFRGPVEAQGCLSEDRSIYPRNGREDPAPRESRIGGSADGGLVKQVARRTDFRRKLRGLAAVRAATVRFVSIVRGRKRIQSRPERLLFTSEIAVKSTHKAAGSVSHRQRLFEMKKRRSQQGFPK
jgi:hypothetical protein